MRAVYLTVKYITIVGTFLQGFFEHLSCRMYDVLIEDGRYLRSNEMCGHIEHELIKIEAPHSVCASSRSFSIC